MIIEGTYFSKSLSRHVSYVAVLPKTLTPNTHVLFLLHGVNANEKAWLVNVPMVKIVSTPTIKTVKIMVPRLVKNSMTRWQQRFG